MARELRVQGETKALLGYELLFLMLISTGFLIFEPGSEATVGSGGVGSSLLAERFGWGETLRMLENAFDLDMYIRKEAEKAVRLQKEAKVTELIGQAQ